MNDVKVVAHLCEWDSGWRQYHDETDPLPDKWDETPDCVAAFVMKIDADIEIDRLKAAMQKTIDDNLYLADGDDCTLIELKRALAIQPSGEPPMKAVGSTYVLGRNARNYGRNNSSM